MRLTPRGLALWSMVIAGAAGVSATLASKAVSGDYYTKVNVNDAPDGGRFTIEAFMLESFIDSLDTTTRPLLLRFARSNGKNSFLITWDLAIRIRRGEKRAAELTSLGRLPIDGLLKKNEEVWALWRVPRDWGWTSPRDLTLVYGDEDSRLGPLDTKALEKAKAIIPKEIMQKEQEPWKPNLQAFDVPPVPKKAPAPIYPRTAEGYGYKGTVTLGARIRTDGTVANVIVLHSSAHHVLNVAALKAVSRWTFTPGTKAGRVVEGTMVVPIRFVPKGG